MQNSKMNFLKKAYFKITIVAMFIVTLLASTFLHSLNTNSRFPSANASESAPTVNGQWTDGIDRNNNFMNDFVIQAGRNGNTPETAYLITKPEDLAYLTYLTREGSGYETAKYYQLGADIDLSGRQWIPIGNPTYATTIRYSFLGAIDGAKATDSNGNVTETYKITGLTILNSTTAYNGLIATSLGINSFTNITFEDVYITSTSSYNAALVAYANTVDSTGSIYSTLKNHEGIIIDNISVDGYIYSAVSSSSYTGGIAGYINTSKVNYLSITNCTNRAEISINGYYAGGIVSYYVTDTVSTLVARTDEYLESIVNRSIFNNCHNEGAISATQYAGGIVSSAHYGIFTKCTNTGEISGGVATSSPGAGIAARIYIGGEFVECINYASINAYYPGGIFGTSPSSYACLDILIKDCKNFGEITGKYCGGLYAHKDSPTFMNSIGSTTIKMLDSFNEGEILAELGVGGLFYTNTGNVIIDNCYNSANLESTGTGYAGGFGGTVLNGDLSILNSYNEGDVIAELGSEVGGFVGRFHLSTTSSSNAIFLYFKDMLLTINKSYNLGTVSGKTNVGGFVGQMRASMQINESFNSGTVLSTVTTAAGMIGYWYSPINNKHDSVISSSYNNGEIYAEAVSYAAGLIARMEYTYTKCTAADINTHPETNGDFNLTIRDTTLSFIDSFNSALVTTGATNGGIICYFTIGIATTGSSYPVPELNVNFDKTFAIQDDDLTTKMIQSSISAYVTVTYDQYWIEEYFDNGETIETNFVKINLSRVISKEDFANHNTFSNIKRATIGDNHETDYEIVSYNFNIWGLSTGSSTPYLKDLAGLVVKLHVNGSTVNYDAVLNERFYRTETVEGKTFLGWATSATATTPRYLVGETIVLNKNITTLYAIFEYTRYYLIEIIDDDYMDNSGNLGAYYEGHSTYYIFTLASNGMNYYLRLDDPTDEDFLGWQIFNAQSGENGQWFSVSGTGSLTKNLNLRAFINQNFIDTYSTESYYMIDNTYEISGVLTFRAAKKYKSASFSAELITWSEGDSVDESRVGNGTLTYYNNSTKGSNAPLTGKAITTIQETTALLLEVTPNLHYKVVYMEIIETISGTVQDPKDVTSLVNNNLYTYVIPVGVESFIVRIRFEKSDYEITVNAKTKSNLITGGTILNMIENQINVETPSQDMIMILDEMANIKFDTILEYTDSESSYKFVGYKVYNNYNDNYDYLSIYTSINGNNAYLIFNEIADSDFLSMYVRNNTINIIAEYAETFKFSILLEDDDAGTFTVKVVNANTGEPEDYNAEIEYYEIGTIFIITSQAFDNYEFKNYSIIANGSNVRTEASIRYEILANTNIIASFSYKAYKVVIEAIDINTKASFNDGFIVDIVVTGTELPEGFISFGSTLKLTSTLNPDDYRFEDFYLDNINPSLARAFLNSGEFINTDFLSAYKTIDNTIVISVRYQRQFSVNVSIVAGQEGMGEYTVYYSNDGGVNYNDAEGITVFDIGTLIRIEVEVEEDYAYEFVKFADSTVYPFEIRSKTETEATVVLEPNNTRNIQLEFKKKVVAVSSNISVNGKSANGKISISKTNFVVGDTIVIIYDLEGGHSIKSWTINGENVNSLPNAELEGNSVRLLITETWLKTHKGELNCEIKSSLNTGIVSTIVIVSIAIPTLIVVLVVFFVMNAKTKKKVAVELKAEQARNYTMNTSTFIQDLRQGKNVGKVTDEDVKAEMKRRKQDKKDKK